MKVLVTFCNLKVSDGASLRAHSLIHYWKPDVVLSVSGDNIYETNQILHENIITEEKRPRLFYKVVLRLIIERSFNSARIPGFNKNQAKYIQQSSEIFVHTTRVTLKIPRAFKHKVSQVDLCDELVGTYRAASYKALRNLKIIHFIVFLLESFREATLIEKFKNAKLFYISTPLGFSKIHYSVLPQYYPSFNTISTVVHCHYKYGVIGNFRTVANRQIFKNAADQLDINFDDMIAIGLGASQITYDYPGVVIYGEYEDLEEIKDQFEIGLCLVDLQGGIQNKVIDYLRMNKIAVVSDNVFQAFQRDNFYKILTGSPFLIRATEFYDGIEKQIYSDENFRKNKSILFSLQER